MIALFLSLLASAVPSPAAEATRLVAEAVAPEARAASRRGATVAVRRSRFGRILVGGSGRTLYLFTRERGPVSRCYGDCARAWPPFLTQGAPRARRPARRALLGTTRRRDGTTQVTYRGHPLYYYVSDRRPGDIFCQGVFEFGGTWYVVSPRGRAIR